ncbi:MAG: DUF4270 domain-containing protein [Paludibacteraceae bacterium]
MTTDFVKEIQPSGDKIIIDVDTFHISTETLLSEPSISRPDSFLLGTFTDDIYGTTRADILTQFHYPEAYQYMDPTIAETTADSAVLNISYSAKSFFGLSESPVQFSVYELNDSLIRKENYYTNINPSKYVDFSKPLVKQVETVDSTSTSSKTSLKNIRIKMSDEFVQRFFTTDPLTYASKYNFLKFFKGLYITTTFGSATLINISDIQLILHTHYKYKSDGSTALSPLTFPANIEVRRVNRVEHSNQNPALLTDANLNYICAPANYYTQIKIPIGRMRDRIAPKITNKGKRLVINSSILTVNIADKDSLGTALPYISNMLLIKKDKMADFFANKELPSDTIAFNSSISSTAISATKYKYYYKFDALAKLILDEIENTNHQELEMVLVPVKLKYSSSSSTTLMEVNPSYSMEAAAIYSGKNSRIPMKMEVVFSGF